MDEQVRILCVDDEANVLRALERIFLDDDFEIYTATSGDEGLKLLETAPDIQVIISDYRMPGMTGVEFLRKVCSRWPDTVRIVLSGYADTAAIVEAINDGQIYKFIPKPWNDDELRITIIKAVETYFLHKRNQELAMRLAESNEELHLINENLERIVTERTAELILQNKALVHTRNILQMLPVGVVCVVPDGVVVQCNETAARIIGKECEMTLGEKMVKVLPQPFTDFISRLFEQEQLSDVVFLNGESLLLKGVHVHAESQEAVVVTFVATKCNG